MKRLVASVCFKRQNSYMKRRLEQLQEEAELSDASARRKKIQQLHESEKLSQSQEAQEPQGSLVDKDARMAKIYSKLEQNRFEESHKSAISYSKIPSYADKQAQDLALSQPWTGGKDVASTVQMTTQRKSDKLQTAPVKPPVFVKKTPAQQIETAREKSLDYQLLKHTKTDDGFVERYRERLLGPEQVSRISMSATFGNIKSMADAEIEKARERGEFDNLPRGKPLENGYDKGANAYLDRTEYHLNNVLKRQEVTLPWIEKQGSVRSEINKFREKLQNEWLTRAIHLIDEQTVGESYEQKLNKARHFSAANNYKQLKDLSWEQKKLEYMQVALRRLNDSIRGYNLQAPMPSQILYLQPKTELERCYTEAAKKLVARCESNFKTDSGKSRKLDKKAGLFSFLRM